MKKRVKKESSEAVVTSKKRAKKAKADDFSLSVETDKTSRSSSTEDDENNKISLPVEAETTVQQCSSVDASILDNVATDVQSTIYSGPEPTAGLVVATRVDDLCEPSVDFAIAEIDSIVEQHFSNEAQDAVNPTDLDGPSITLDEIEEFLRSTYNNF